MEGVAFAARRNLRLMKAAGYPIDLLVASGGGAKTTLWLESLKSKTDCGSVGMFLRSASLSKRRKESFVHRKEQSLESLTQKLKEIIARRPRWSRW